MTRPNLLLIMTDQQRHDALGCAGDWCETPHLDSLVSDGGVRFANCITTSPVCVPARRTMATGHYPHLTGIWDNGASSMAADTPTWMAAIRDAGYRTSLIGKTHFTPHHGDLRANEPLLRSFGLDDIWETPGPRACARTYSHMTEEWHAAGHWDAYAADYRERFANVPWVVRPSTLPLELYYDTWVGRRAARYLRDYDRDEPWCCWVSFGGPHEPWDTPEPYASRYDRETMPAALPRFTDAAPERPRGRLDRMPPNPAISPADVAAMRADYAGNVALIDDQVGQLIATIKARGDWDNTVVILCSDHGELNGDHGLIYKSTFLDSALRVPLLVSTPATRAAGQAATSQALVEWFDVGATLADYAGATLHRQFARSLAPAVADPSAAHRDYAISQLAHETMILTHDWKLALNAAGAPYLLFDRHADPDEQRNLAGSPEHRDTEQALRERIMTHIYTTQL